MVGVFTRLRGYTKRDWPEKKPFVSFSIHGLFLADGINIVHRALNWSAKAVEC